MVNIAFKEVGDILQNFYEHFPSLTLNTLQGYYSSLEIIKDRVCEESREALLEFNLPLVTVREDIVYKHILKDDDKAKLIELLSAKEYVIEVYKHLGKLLGHKAVTAELQKPFNVQSN